MKYRHYQLQINDVTDQQQTPTQISTADQNRLSFHAVSHDDVLALVSRLQQTGLFDAETSATMMVSLKLLGEIVIQQRSHPLFSEFYPHFNQFMRQFKAQVQQQSLSNTA